MASTFLLNRKHSNALIQVTLLTLGEAMDLTSLIRRGRRLAIVCDVDDHSDASDIKDRPRKIAHVNLNAIDVDQTNAFLIENLRLQADQFANCGLRFFTATTATTVRLSFCGTARPTINHIAFELPDLEAVMRGAGRMRDAGYPIEWGPGRHGAGDNVFAYFAGPRKFRSNIRLMFCRLTIATCHTAAVFRKWPPGRMDQWGITPPHTQRWKRIQDMLSFRSERL